MSAQIIPLPLPPRSVLRDILAIVDDMKRQDAEIRALEIKRDCIARSKRKYR